MEENKKSVFDTLSAIDVNEHKEEKNNLSYLSWPWAWAELQKRYPDATYTIERFGEDKKPYLYDENTGYMVFTTVTIEGQTREMWLPVMDNNNKALKSAPYRYQTYKYENGKRVWNKEERRYEMVDKFVQAATMFDINKTIMRCLVKNIGMFGLGLYIYAGEDLPEADTNESVSDSSKQKPETDAKNQADEKRSKAIKRINDNTSILQTVYHADITSEKYQNYVKEKAGIGSLCVNQLSDKEIYSLDEVLSTMIKVRGQRNTNG